MLKLIPFLLIVCLTLSGCSIFKQPSPVAVKPPQIPASLTTECPKLPSLQSNLVDDTIDLLLEVVGLYHECAAGKKDLATAVRAREK